MPEQLGFFAAPAEFVAEEPRGRGKATRAPRRDLDYVPPKADIPTVPDPKLEMRARAEALKVKIREWLVGKLEVSAQEILTGVGIPDSEMLSFLPAVMDVLMIEQGEQWRGHETQAGVRFK